MGKWMALTGAVLAVVGGLMYLFGRLGLGPLPGDVSFGGKNWRVYLPVGTCVVLSVLLTLLLWILTRLRR